MNEEKNAKFIADRLAEAADALAMANLVASTDAAYYGALTVAALAVEETQRSVARNR